MLQQALSLLNDAKKAGGREQLGSAHLAVVAALDEMIDQAEPGAQRLGRYRQMAEHADAALEAYRDLELPWMAAQAHLAKAAVLAAVAREEERGVARFESIDRSLEHCHQALTALNAWDGFHYGVLSQAYATAVATMLQLRALVDDEEGQRALDGLIEAYSEGLGTALGWDVRRRGEGNDLFFLARALQTLAGEPQDPARRREALQTAHELAAMAASMLWRTSDSALAQAALDLAEETRAQIEGSGVMAPLGPRHLVCPACGHAGPVTDAFCGQCGTRLARAGQE